MRYLKIGAVLIAAAVLGLVFQARHKEELQPSFGRGAVAAYAVKDAPKLAFSLPKLPAQAPALEAASRQAAAATRPAPAPSTPGTIESAMTARRLIRSASIALELASYETGAQRAEEIASELGGDVAEAKASSAEGERAAGTLTIRVPADRFRDAFRRLSGLGTVRSREIRSQDVTKEYLDLETRV